MKVYQNFSLLNFNTFNLSTIAKKFVIIEQIQDLYEISNFIENDKFYILGFGSNTLFVNDFYDGTIIHINLKGVKKEIIGDYAFVELMSGENWNKIVWNTVKTGLSGIENLVSIPGSVGGAVVQNIGAYGVEIRDVLISVDCFDIYTNSFIKLNKNECNFEYRHSIFKTNDFKNRIIITKVFLKLSKNKNTKSFNLDYPGIKEELSQFRYVNLTPRIIAKAIDNIRKNKLPDYKLLGNAGSIFKNPIITKEKFEVLYQNYPNLVFFPTSNPNKIKLSAGWLIENAGLKGLCIGDSCVYEKHALIIVNKGNAKGTDILNLINLIKNKIFERFQIILEEEINIVL